MLLILLFIFTSIFTKVAVATGEFNVNQNVNYTVSTNGVAAVSQEINLTNNISQIYAKEYQVNLSDSDIQNLKGHDKYGDIVDSVKKNGATTTANLVFQKPTIGKGQTNQFFLEYSISDFAKKKGNTWEIQFPVFDNLFDNQQINVSLDVPTYFGDLSFSSIPIINTHTVNNRTQIQFNQNQIKNKILLIFGNHQLFDFTLNYYIKNEQKNNVIAEIPIPPDTNNQTITFESFEPMPLKIKADPDGNWLAQYELSPTQNMEISIKGQAKIHPPTLSEVTPDVKTETSAQPFWPTDDPLIDDISRTLTTPKSIYQYVVSTLSYNYSGIDTAKRQGALSAIANPDKALCTEFTDLFVTVARHNGIPSREIEGFAYSNNTKVKPTNTNSDILHAWPEYYDQTKKSWIQVDPTWEKTTNGIDYFTDLDLNHIAFVIHGQNSTSPPPPGSYKKDKYTKSVFVDFSSKNIDTTFQPPKLTLNGNKINIVNPNFYKLPSFTIKLNNTKWAQNIPSMPPLSSQEYNLPPISFQRSILPEFQKLSFTIETQNDSSPIITSLTYKPHYLNLSITIGIIIFILCLGGIILTTSKKS